MKGLSKQGVQIKNAQSVNMADIYRAKVDASPSQTQSS
jgi:hypothetical protein